MESNILEMNKTISISSKNQITIPKKVMEYLGFTKEAKIKVSKGSLIVTPVKENEDMEFSDLILEDLIKEGYSGINIQYPTTEDTVEEITEKYIAPNIESVSKTVEEENARRKKQGLPEIKINFIVHSMGTGILRYYLKTHKLNNLGKVIFISPPSHGSQLSDNPISDILKDTLGNSVRQFKTSSDSFVNSLGEPDYQCYVMIGNKSGNFLYSILIPGIDDGMVPFKTSRLNNCNYKVIENATHTSILKDKRTLNEITDYLKN